MWLHILVSYIHFISIFLLFSTLLLSLITLKEKMVRKSLLLLVKADLSFGIFAITAVATGVLRLFFFGKGVDYYLSNPVFIAKITLFILVGICSILPTAHFLKMRKSKEEIIEVENFKLIQLILKIELALLLIIPLLGVAVARGI